MRIAVTYEDGKIYQHFGHTSQFKLYDIEDGKITSTQIVETMDKDMEPYQVSYHKVKWMY